TTRIVFNNMSYAYSAAIQADGRIVVAGSAPINGIYKFLVVRYNTNGTLDTTWGGTGKVITSISQSSDASDAVIVQNDGKIVAAGHSNVYGTNNWDLALVRYSGCGVRTAFDFDDDQRADFSVFRPSNATWYLLQSMGGFRA